VLNSRCTQRPANNERRMKMSIVNKKINDSELKIVSGGKDMAKYLPSNHGRHIGMYEAEGYLLLNTAYMLGLALNV